MEGYSGKQCEGDEERPYVVDEKGRMEPRRKRLIIEAFGCDLRLVTVENVYQFLESLTAALKMRILAPPTIVRLPYPWEIDLIDAQNPWEFGISAQLMWKESGCSIHTTDAGGYVALDAFSCRSMDRKIVERLFREYFAPIKLMTCEPTFPDIPDFE